MAVLNAIAASEGSTLVNVLYPQTEESTGRFSDVKVCALLESNGGPNEIALVAATLVKEGFTAIKLKVARQTDSTVDIAIIKEVRKKVGWDIELRADANRRWDYDESVKFGLSVKDSGLQYVEEPVNNEDDIIKFCEETGLPVALDETINCIRENHFQVLAKYTHPKIVAFRNVVVFLHGFLGTGEDWISIMKAISGSARCIAVDLPGHGRSKLVCQDYGLEEPSLSIVACTNILQQLFDRLECQKIVLVGYSMGARIALYMALRCNDKVGGAIIISGSPGLADEETRKVRRVKDDFAACSLVSSGLELFLDSWYSADLWISLRNHPHFKEIFSSRLQHCDLKILGKVLSDLSVGRQPSLWEDLKSCRVPLQFIVGEKDVKFKRIARKMHETICQGAANTSTREIVEIPCSGHAAHLENPLPVISAISQFIREVIS